MVKDGGSNCQRICPCMDKGTNEMCLYTAVDLEAGIRTFVVQHVTHFPRSSDGIHARGLSGKAWIYGHGNHHIDPLSKISDLLDALERFQHQSRFTAESSYRIDEFRWLFRGSRMKGHYPRAGVCKQLNPSRWMRYAQMNVQRLVRNLGHRPNHVRSVGQGGRKMPVADINVEAVGPSFDQLDRPLYAP